MPAITGQNAAISWVYSGGTIALDTDYRSIQYTPSIEMFDQSAGADANKTYITGQKDGSVSYSGIFQSGGTAITAALTEGTGGTLIWGEEGTAVGKPKHTMPAISQGASANIQYNALIEISCTFQQNGAKVDATY